MDMKVLNNRTIIAIDIPNKNNSKQVNVKDQILIIKIIIPQQIIPALKLNQESLKISLILNI